MRVWDISGPEEPRCLHRANLDKHVENVRLYGKPAVVALNQFATDTPEEIEAVRKRCEELGIGFAAASVRALWPYAARARAKHGLCIRPGATDTVRLQ